MNLRTCQFSDCRRYRYTLWREWDMTNESYLMVIGLNPSTADETKDDPTIRRCVAFAKRWGYGALCMTNLFAYRATDPRRMKGAVEPVGTKNDYWLNRSGAEASMVLAAWGKHGRFLERDETVRCLFARLFCLKRNGDGTPAHPLYIPELTEPFLYE